MLSASSHSSGKTADLDTPYSTRVMFSHVMDVAGTNLNYFLVYIKMKSRHSRLRKARHKDVTMLDKVVAITNAKSPIQYQ